MRIRKDLFFSVVAGLWFSVAVCGVFAEPPVLFFSDITSGPKIGFNGNGAVVTVWGRGLGLLQGDSKVFCCGAEASFVYTWGNADQPANLYQSHGMQMIAFQVSHLSQDGLGEIYAVVGSSQSNTLPFTVRNGGIYFVDDDSPNDPGTGTFSDPWRSPGTFYSNADAGDICYIRQGTYSGTYGYSSGGGNFIINIGEGAGYCATGTETMPIAYIGYPGETALFDALGEASPTYNFRVYSLNADAEWFVISKLALKAYNCCVGSAGTGWRIVGNDCEGITRTTALWAGIIGTGGKSAKIFGNIIYGGRSASRMDHAIYPGGCPSNGGIEVGWNHIYDCSFARGPLISINHESTRCGDTEYVEDCYVHNNVVDATNYPCRGVSIFHLSYEEGDPVEPNAYVYNNIFINCGIVDETGQQPAIAHTNAHAYIYNNTFYNTRTMAIAVYAYSGSSSYPVLSASIVNNIIHMRPDASDYIYVASNYTNPLTIDRNCYFGLEDYDGSEDIHPVNDNPGFGDEANWNFHLNPVSPCIDNGSSAVSPIVGKDFDGVPRFQGAGFDIGAYEYTDGSYTPPLPPPPPLYSKGDVNGDGFINIADIQCVVNEINEQQTWERSDVNEDGDVDEDDITAIIEIILGN